MAKRSHPKVQPQPLPEGGPGASDATSGGGAGAGIPDAGTQMRTGGKFAGGDVERDRARLFPETVRKPPGKTGPQPKHPPRSEQRRKARSPRRGT